MNTQKEEVKSRLSKILSKPHRDVSQKVSVENSRKSSIQEPQSDTLSNSSSTQSILGNLQKEGACIYPLDDARYKTTWNSRSVKKLSNESRINKLKKAIDAIEESKSSILNSFDHQRQKVQSLSKMTFYGQDGKKRDIADIFSPLSNRVNEEYNQPQNVMQQVQQQQHIQRPLNNISTQKRQQNNISISGSGSAVQGNYNLNMNQNSNQNLVYDYQFSDMAKILKQTTNTGQHKKIMVKKESILDMSPSLSLNINNLNSKLKRQIVDKGSKQKLMRVLRQSNEYVIENTQQASPKQQEINQFVTYQNQLKSLYNSIKIKQ
ncbi:UNKNOWN [Stylonychia lemnae]|uniref:Uncharacterized protein n=1 Tax=Stylonychia lemnae TaxID=5949 RepID=A0A078B3X6_STYLE|nr:UNKNOWN [Stylonychia lemnae]|eukprot:CDW88218.1 UNKNOWN [Stylonychia lemnae]